MKYILTLQLALLLVMRSTPALAGDSEGCLNCHQYQGLARVDDSGTHVASFYIDPKVYGHGQGPHASLSCTDCHQRSEVEVFPHQPVSKVDCARTCHLQSKGNLETRFSHESVARMLDRSVHKTSTLEKSDSLLGDTLAAQQSQCLLCHEDPIATDARHVASLDVVRSCGVCHSNDAIKAQFKLPDATATFLASYHGKALLLGSTDTADCLNCHAGLGQNVHGMIEHDAIGSPTSVPRLPETCRTSGCHGTAGTKISTAEVHLDVATTRGIEFDITCIFLVIISMTFGPSLLLTTLKLFHHVLARDDPEHGHHSHLAEVLLAHSHTRDKLIRFKVHQRIQHWILALSFTTLCVTGFPMKFADRPWAGWVIRQIGGFSTARTVHHLAGSLMIGGLIYHLTYVFSLVWRNRKVHNQGLIASTKALPLIPTPRDGAAMLKLILYYAFLRRGKPAAGRFGPEEKFEYAGVFWGTFMLGLTGLILWGNAWITRHFSGRILTIAVLLHTFEAFLALLYIGIGHMTHVIFSPHVFPGSPAMFTGETPKQKLIKSHGGLLREVAAEAGVAPAKEVPHA